MTGCDDQPAILCLAHLDWDFVWQRPQHILSRLARRWPVAYVHDPAISAGTAGEPAVRLVAQQGDLTAWQPVFPDRPEIIGAWRDQYTAVVRDLLQRLGWAQFTGGTLRPTRPLIVWFYTPTPVYMLDQVPHELVVYDVMDELANFKGASSDLRQRERCLLAHTDLVFTGGRSLYEARRHHHPQVYLFPSGVDAAHFARALDPATPVATEIATLSRPVLGYYGVIDERLDLDLIAALAADHPEWSIVLVGPVRKIEPACLPRLPNLHYPGQQPYARLPEFLKGFDVCLMPFALNDATRFISPTKTLEYMAAHKPIVSTPVHDVVANWGQVVRVATADAFAAAVQAALEETPAQRAARIAQEQHCVEQASWERMVEEMAAIMMAALERRVSAARPDS